MSRILMSPPDVGDLEEEYVLLSDNGRQWLVDHTYGVPHLYGYMVPSTLAVEVAGEVGAEGPQDMGKVMGRVMPEVGSRADGRRVSAAVKARLGD
jgi:hypothetical protein